MLGMSSTTGKVISGRELLMQSLHDVLLTPRGSRVMRRDYGSEIFDLLDHPGNAAGLLRIQTAAVEAILRHEPRIIPTRVVLDSGAIESGEFGFAIEGVTTIDLGDLPAGSPVNISIPWG